MASVAFNNFMHYFTGCACLGKTDMPDGGLSSAYWFPIAGKACARFDIVLFGKVVTRVGGCH